MYDESKYHLPVFFSRYLQPSMQRILYASRKIPTICLFFSYKNNIFAPVAHNKCCISWWLNKQIAIQCHKSRLSWQRPLLFSLYCFPYPAYAGTETFVNNAVPGTLKNIAYFAAHHLSCLYWGGFLTLRRVSWAAYQHSKEVYFCLPVVAYGLAHMQQRMQYKSARNNATTFWEPRICGRTWVRPNRKTINILRNLTGSLVIAVRPRSPPWKSCFVFYRDCAQMI